MGLQAQIEEEEKELEKLRHDEDRQPDDVAGEIIEDEVDKSEKSPEGEDDSSKDDDTLSKGDDIDDDTLSKGDDIKDTQEENTNSIAAQLRIERKQRKELENTNNGLKAQLAESIQQIKPQETTSEEPKQKKQLSADDRLNRIEDQQRQRQLVTEAINEFTGIEADFSKDTPDYHNASAHMVTKMVQGAQYANPGITKQQAIKATQHQILQIAARASSNGLNPAETLYNLSLERYGYTKEPDNKQSKDPSEQLRKVQSNKKRSANSLSGGGQMGSAVVTLEQAGNMDMGAFSKLSESEIDQMIADASAS